MIDSLLCNDYMIISGMKELESVCQEIVGLARLVCLSHSLS